LLVPSLLSIASLHKRKLLKLRLSYVSLNTLKIMLKFSYKSFGVSLIGALTLQSGMVIIGLVGSSAEVAFYNAAYRIYSSVRQLLSWTVDPFRPALSRLFARNREEALPVLTSVMLVSFGAGAVACCCLIFAVPDLLTLWLGDTVPGASVSLAAQVLLCGLLINMIHIPLGPATDAAGKPGALFWGQLCWLILTLSLSIPLAASFGIVGAAIGLSAPLMIVEPLMLILAMRALEYRKVEWLKLVGAPVAAIIFLSSCTTALVSLLSSSLDLPYDAILLSAVFGVCALGYMVILNRKFQFRRSLELLNVGL
jgi:O-antigen/teichoic acid export membrane protein